MSPADAAMPFPQYAVAVAVGLLILAVYFLLIAVTVARLRCWRERKPARRTNVRYTPRRLEGPPRS